MARKKEASTSLNIRKSERIEKQTTLDPSPVKKKLETIEKQTDPSPLRRSDRGKKLVEVHDLPTTRSNKDKIASHPKMSARDVEEDNQNGRQDQIVAGRKRKSLTALRYKSVFKPQLLQIESSSEDVDLELKSNSKRFQDAPEKDKDDSTSLEGNSMDIDQLQHECPQTKPLDKEKQIEGNLSQSNINIADGNKHILHKSLTRINHDVENQRDCDPCDKVPESCKAADAMENGENNTNVQNSGNMLNLSNFVEFWAPVQLSNVQIEQYCFTLLSNAIALRSSPKSDTVEGEALRGVLISLRKCCNHPYLEDLALEFKIRKGPEPDKLIEAAAKASGKLQLLDRILCESKKRHLRVLILYQPTTGGSVPLASFLVEYINMRFGEDSYECVVSGCNPSKKQAALNNFNKDMTRFIFFLETRACNPSIRLLSTDIVLMYDSDLNPANDLKWLQKISVHSQAEQIMILRLYAKSTIEEKIVLLSEQNLSVDSKSKSRYQTLLMWGASEQFDNLNEFLSQDVDNISSDESLLNEVMEEFLYLISNKYKSKATDNLHITRVGNSGKSVMLNSEIKTHLPNGDQPHLFWKTLLERPDPKWKFVSVSTPRQRKRPSFFLSGIEDGGVRTRRKTVNNTMEPAQLKPVTEGETGVVNEGVPVHNESQSSSGNETSLHDLLKSTLPELFKVLKLTEHVKIIVEKFLEFVLKNYFVSKEHTETLQAFMISLCWIGSSLANFKIDRSESFKIATNHCNFTCEENAASEVYLKLHPAKEAFLEDTEIQIALKDYIPELKGAEPDNEISQSSENLVSQNHDACNEDVSRKEHEEIEIEYFNREWDVKKLNLENDRQTEESLIRVLYSNTSRIRSEKLKLLDKNFATKLEEHEKMREIHFKELKERLLAAKHKVSLHSVNAQNIPELGPTLSVNPIEAENHVHIESTGSPTSEKQMDNATMSSEPIVDVPAQQCDNVADIVDSVELEVAEIDSNQENVTRNVEESNETGAKDVVPHVESGDTGMPVGNCNRDFAEDCSIRPDTSHEVEDCDETGPYDDDTIPPHVESGEIGMSADNSNKEIADNGTNTSHAVEDHHETSPHNVEPLVSVEMGMPGSICEKENGEDNIISPETSQPVEERHESDPVDVALHVDSAVMEMPAGDLDKENAKDSSICPDTSPVVQDQNETGPNDVEPHVEHVEVVTPAGNSNEDNADTSVISPDAAHGGEDHNDSCASSSNSPSANVSQSNTPSVHPVASPALDHEIQNEPLQQLGDIVMQDNEDEAVAISLTNLNINNRQLLDASQHSQITPEEPSCTGDPASRILLETTSEDPGLAVDISHQPLVPSSDAPASLITAEIPNQNASQPDEHMVDTHVFNNHNQVGPRIRSHSDPLQAELEQLCTLKDNVPKFLQEAKQRLNSERDKEIADMIAQINLKYEAKNREVEVTWHSRKKQIETNLNKIAMNKVLADAFRSKCQDLTPSGHPGMPRVTSAGFMQQLQRYAVQPSMRRLPDAASSSSARQSSGSQLTTPSPPQSQPSLLLPPTSPTPQLQTRRQPPLQIVHQPSALFSTTPNRPPPLNNNVRPPPLNNNVRPPPTYTTVRPPSTTIRQPTITTTTTPSTSRPPLTDNPITPSDTHSRLAPGMPNRPAASTNTAIINNTSTSAVSNINPIIPSTTPIRSSPTVTPSTTPSTSTPLPAVNPITSSSSLSRAPHGINQIVSASMQYKPPANNRPMDISAANLRINSETRNQTSQFRPSANGETHAPAPNMQRALGPHIRPPASSGIRAPAPHIRSLGSSDIRAPAPHLRPFRSATSVPFDFGTHRRTSQHATNNPSLNSPKSSQSPILPPRPTSSPQPFPPQPSEPYTVPPPPPSELDTVSPPPPSESLTIPPPPPPPPPTESITVPPPLTSESDSVPPPLPSGPYFVPSPPPPPETSPPLPPTSVAQTPQTLVLPQHHAPSTLSVASASQTQLSQVPSKLVMTNMNNTPRWVDVTTPPTRSHINLVVVDAPTPPLRSPINLVDITGSSSPDLVCLSDDD